MLQVRRRFDFSQYMNDDHQYLCEYATADDTQPFDIISILSLAFHLLLFYSVVMLSLLFGDVEVCAVHVHAVACRTQHGASSEVCVAAHWRDVLLRCGAHSGHLRNSVDAEACRLAYFIIPWDDLRALAASRLIAFDKFHGV